MRPKKYLSKYLSRRLSEPFLCNIYGQSIQTYMLNDKKINDLVGISKARKFITSFGINNIKGIITTNYDLIIEYALGTKRFNYGKKDAHIKGRGHNPLFPWQNTPVILNGRLVLSKLHGSISYDGVDYWSSGICGLNGKAIIIPPYPEKHNHNEFSKEWKCARQTLESIDKLVIFGFNFNDYDIAILELLKTNSKKIKKIIIYDIESKMEKASKIWDPNKITELNINTIDDSISFLKSHTQTKLI
ncbi:hypothetical protein GALL_123940 [mine drainage metagenome]|uniref:Uncharacterized protein n=1 Tax=mine drainage metagenome TaxID=410659 RepID=A0A1J5SAI9_9ZZZZ